MFHSPHRNTILYNVSFPTSQHILYNVSFSTSQHILYILGYSNLSLGYINKALGVTIRNIVTYHQQLIWHFSGLDVVHDLQALIYSVKMQAVGIAISVRIRLKSSKRNQ